MERLHRAFSRTALFLCLTLLPVGISPPAVAQQTPQSPIKQTARPERPPDDSIVLAVTVMDRKGNYVGGLGKTAFSVYDNKVPQEVSFFSAADEPASIGIIFDLSGSTLNQEREQLVAAGKALLRFIKLSHGANEYFVIGFANHAQLLLDWTGGEKAAEEMSSKLNRVNVAGGGTALFDACYLGIEKMRSRPSRKRAILLISDGMDNLSHYKFTDVRERLRETGVLLYSIGIVARNDPGSSLGLEGQAVMDELSAVSGGVAVFPDSRKKIDAAFDQIAIELRSQYLLGFKPPGDSADGKWHQLKVKVTPPPTAPPSMSNLSARSRGGYYAAKNLR